MKQFKLSNEVAKTLLSRLEIMKTDKNKVRLTIGLKNTGKGITCKATVVNGGMMLVTGFATSNIPKDYVDGEVYLSCAVKASTLCSYISGLLPLGSDITFSCNDKELVLKVGTQASVSLALVGVSECEPELPDDSKEAFCAIQNLAVADFLPIFKKGGYLSQNEPDVRCITDRVVLDFTDSTVTACSSEGVRFSTAWCSANVQFINALHALSCITEDEDERRSYMQRMNKGELTEDDFFTIAKDNGYEKGKLSISLLTATVNTLLKAIGNATQIKVLITSRYLRVLAGNVQTVYPLAGKCASVYKQAFNSWNEKNYSCNLVVDKESFSHALHIISLSGELKKPFNLFVKSDNLVAADLKGNSVSTKIITSQGESTNVGAYFSCEKLLNAIAKFPNGNICLSFDTVNTKLPVIITNGNIDDESMNCKTFIAAVNYTPSSEEATEQDVEQNNGADETEDSAVSEEATE